MKAKHIMTTRVETVGPNETVREVALRMVEKGVSALPVVERGKVIGIVSEGDLLHRQELGTDQYRRRSSWFHVIEDEDATSAFQRKAHGLHAHEVMTHNVISISPDLPLSKIADIMESNNIKQVLVIADSRLLGIISRADIVRALATRPEGAGHPVSSDDEEIRVKVIDAISNVSGSSPWLVTVIVHEREVFLYGTVEDEGARAPTRKAAAAVPFVKKVNDHRSVLQPF